MSEPRYISPEVELAAVSALPAPAFRWLFDTYRLVNTAIVYERLEVVARDSHHARLALPRDVVSWDFAKFPDGRHFAEVQA